MELPANVRFEPPSRIAATINNSLASSEKSSIHPLLLALGDTGGMLLSSARSGRIGASRIHRTWI